MYSHLCFITWSAPFKLLRNRNNNPVKILLVKSNNNTWRKKWNCRSQCQRRARGGVVTGRLGSLGRDHRAWCTACREFSLSLSLSLSLCSITQARTKILIDREDCSSFLQLGCEKETNLGIYPDLAENPSWLLSRAFSVRRNSSFTKRLARCMPQHHSEISPCGKISTTG